MIMIIGVGIEVASSIRVGWGEGATEVKDINVGIMVDRKGAAVARTGSCDCRGFER
jgi:hypothetical protein